MTRQFEQRDYLHFYEEDFQAMENGRCPLPELLEDNLMQIIGPRLKKVIDTDTVVDFQAGRGMLFQHLPDTLRRRLIQVEIVPENVDYINNSLKPPVPAKVADVTQRIPFLPDSSQKMVVSLSGLDMHTRRNKRKV
jgi:hypothetical protein